MRSRIAFGSVVGTCCLLVSLLSAVEARSAVVDPFADSARVRELIVRSAYENLQRYAAFSSPSLRFELSDFETLFPEQFDEVLWLDAVTMPGGRSLDMAREKRTNGNTGVERVVYRASWRKADSYLQTSAEGARLGVMKISDVLSAVKGAQASLSEVLAISLFRVRIEMNGRSRSYKAAFAWVPATEGQDAAFVVFDNVSQGVEEAARESVAVLQDLSFLNERPEGDGVPSRAVCTATSSTTNQGYVGSGSSGHVSGSHNSSASFRVVCSCSSTCVSKCVASIPSASCSDSGFTDVCHKMASALQANTVQNDNGNLAGAGCAAGYGCVQRGCLFCLCGLSVGVNVSGVTVSFSSSEATWSGNLQYSRTCAKCV